MSASNATPQFREVTEMSFEELVEELVGVCELLDAGDPSGRYQRALKHQREKLLDSELTPSARLLRELRRSGAGFAEYTKVISQQHRQRLLDKAGHEPAVLAEFSAEAAESLVEQAVIERSDRSSFDEYLMRTLGPVFA